MVGAGFLGSVQMEEAYLKSIALSLILLSSFGRNRPTPLRDEAAGWGQENLNEMTVTQCQFADLSIQVA